MPGLALGRGFIALAQAGIPVGIMMPEILKSAARVLARVLRVMYRLGFLMA